MNQIAVLGRLQPGIKNGITTNGLERVDNVVPARTITIVKHFYSACIASEGEDNLYGTCLLKSIPTGASFRQNKNNLN